MVPFHEKCLYRRFRYFPGSVEPGAPAAGSGTPVQFPRFGTLGREPVPVRRHIPVHPEIAAESGQGVTAVARFHLGENTCGGSGESFDCVSGRGMRDVCGRAYCYGASSSKSGFLMGLGKVMDT